MTDETTKSLVIAAWPDAGKKLGLGKSATYEAIARGDIPSIRIGRRILIPKRALERLLAVEPAKAS